MEGTLWKWTNYFTGWQPRWFVLEDGILSYYRSQEDVVNGCKGSIKMTVCDVSVHATDASRLDLIIPGEAHFYVKAATPQERQQWLVALGSSKAGLSNGPMHISIKEDSRADESLKSKKSELRLYCDLLMQQVHSVKTAVTTEPAQPDIGQLDEATSLLSATCDTFIAALEDCMQLAAGNSSVPPSPVPPSPSRKSPSSRSVPWSFSHQTQRSHSMDSSTPGTSNRRSSSNSPEDGSTSIVRGYIPGRRGGSRSAVSRSSKVRTISESGLETEENHSMENNHVERGGEMNNGHSSSRESSITPTPHVNGSSDRLAMPTFFSTMKTSFQDVEVGSNGNIATEPFLEACRSILPIFDKLNPTAFAPVMYDLSGNIKKIHQKLSTDPSSFASLQHIVLYEVGARQHKHSSSATLALLWLKRSLEFVVVLCDELLRGTDDLTVASNAAYTKTLKPFHNFVNRGAYALASKSIPQRSEFFHLLCSSGGAGEGGGEVDEDARDECIREDMMQYITHLRTVVDSLHAFYTNNHLDSPEMV